MIDQVSFHAVGDRLGDLRPARVIEKDCWTLQSREFRADRWKIERTVNSLNSGKYPWHTGIAQITPAGYALTAYSDNYSITNLAAKASLSFCSLSLTEQSVWAARKGDLRFLTGQR